MWTGDRSDREDGQKAFKMLFLRPGTHLLKWGWRRQYPSLTNSTITNPRFSQVFLSTLSAPWTRRKMCGATSVSLAKVGVGRFRRGLISQSQDLQGLANYTGSTFWVFANLISLSYKCLRHHVLILIFFGVGGYKFPHLPNCGNICNPKNHKGGSWQVLECCQRLIILYVKHFSQWNAFIQFWPDI